MDSASLFSHPDETCSPPVIDSNNVVALVFSDIPASPPARHVKRIESTR